MVKVEAAFRLDASTTRPNINVVCLIIWSIYWGFCIADETRQSYSIPSTKKPGTSRPYFGVTCSRPDPISSHWQPIQSRLRVKLDRVDFRIFHVAGESDGKFPVGDFHRDGFDVGAVRSTGFDINIKIFEVVSLHIEGKNALAGT